MTNHLAYTRLPSGCGYSTVLPDMDFETYSEAGYVFNTEKNKWDSIVASPPHGLGAVGAPVYSEHPSTEVLSMAYDLKDGLGPRMWIPCMDPPYELFEHIARGSVLEAWNSAFEYHIWLNVCNARMGWPALPYPQLRDAMAKARAFSLPGKLEKAAIVVNAADQKIADGQRLIRKFSVPHKPSKKDPRRRIRPEEDLEDGDKFYTYNIGDIKAEAGVSAVTPDLSPYELQVWLLDQTINFRGIHIDAEGLANCIEIVRQATERYTAELVAITGGRVQTAGEIQKMAEELRALGCPTTSLAKDMVEEYLEEWGGLPETPELKTAIRILEIRQILGSASVKKLHAIDRRVSADGRLKDLFTYCGADRTGRFAGRGPQPQNLPNSGPSVVKCVCDRHYGRHLDACPWCGVSKYEPLAEDININAEWGIEAVEDAFRVIATRDLATVEHYFGDAISAVSGCLRGLFSAAPGHDLICSDYSAIEAVVLACLAREQWRIDVFNTHGKIYEMSASDITGVPFDTFIQHEIDTGDHHPMRKKVGKVAELASGYQGSVGAWKAFGADKHMKDDDEILAAVRAWRAASPNIVSFWYGLQDAATNAIQFPGSIFEYNEIKYGVKDDVLYCELLSGRKLCYHAPRLHPDVTPWGKETLKITYMGWNTDYKKGPTGWMRLDTYGGKLTENVVQATSRDILVHGMLNVERAGYPLVLHVHDEDISEVPEGFGSVEEYESLMEDVPYWASDWPIRATGGWRGKRYRKD